MAHNANVERIFSMMLPQWCMERDSLLVESVSNILTVVHNSNHISCKQFNDHIKVDSSLLKKVKGAAKYSWVDLTNKFVLFSVYFFAVTFAEYSQVRWFYPTCILLTCKTCLLFGQRKYGRPIVYQNVEFLLLFLSLNKDFTTV